MRSLVRLAARLYPLSWRRRYGAEFDALLEDAHSGWRDVFDVVGGAIIMQISTWSFRTATVACGLLGLIIAAGWAYSLPDTYVSRAVMRVQFAASQDGNTQSREVARIIQEAMSRGSLSSIIQRPNLDLYKNDRKHKPLEDVIEEMKAKDIKIELLRNGPSGATFIVAFSYPDPIIAQKTNFALSSKIIDANFALRSGVTTVDLIDPASLPKMPTSPNRSQIILAGFGLGILAGILTLGIRRWPLIAVSGLAGLALGWAVSAVIPKTYISHAVLRTNAPEQFLGLSKTLLSDDFLKGVIENEHLYEDSRRSQPMDEVIGAMRSRDLRFDVISRDSNSQPTAIAITYRYGDRLKAMHVVSDISNALFRTANQGNASVSPNRPIEFLDTASLPVSPSAPNRTVIAGIGMGVGLAGALIALWVRRLTRAREPGTILPAQS